MPKNEATPSTEIECHFYDLNTKPFRRYVFAREFGHQEEEEGITAGKVEEHNRENMFFEFP